MPSEQTHNSVLHYHINGGSVAEWFKGLDLEIITGYSFTQ